MAEDSSEKCLLKLRKVESKIEQRKLLGIKAAISYDSIQTNARGRGKFRSKSQVRGSLPVVLETANTVANPKIKGIVQHLARSAKSVERRTISKQFAKVVQTKETTVNRDQKKERVRNSMK